MRVVCIADTHGMHDRINTMPEGDVLVSAGDYTAHGTSAELQIYGKWLRSLPYEHIITISGNHDRCASKMGYEKTKHLFEQYGKITYLRDDGITIKGINFYGTPWIVRIGNWYFMYPRGSKEIRDIWRKIPTNTDVLITHMPPANILDRLDRNGEHIGDESLQREVIKRIKPKLHVFGHIHEAYGTFVHDDTTFVNASICTTYYTPTNLPTVIDI